MVSIGEGPNRLTIKKNVAPYIFGGSVTTYTVTFNDEEVTNEKWRIYRDALHNLNKIDEHGNKLQKPGKELCPMLAEPENLFYIHSDNKNDELEFNLPEKYKDMLKLYGLK